MKDRIMFHTEAPAEVVVIDDVLSSCSDERAGTSRSGEEEAPDAFRSAIEGGKYSSVKAEELLVSILSPKPFMTTDDTHDRYLNRSSMVRRLDQKGKERKKERRRFQSCLPMMNPLPLRRLKWRITKTWCMSFKAFEYEILVLSVPGPLDSFPHLREVKADGCFLCMLTVSSLVPSIFSEKRWSGTLLTKLLVYLY